MKKLIFSLILVSATLVNVFGYNNKMIYNIDLANSGAYLQYVSSDHNAIGLRNGVLVRDIGKNVFVNAEKDPAIVSALQLALKSGRVIDIEYDQDNVVSGWYKILNVMVK